MNPTLSRIIAALARASQPTPRLGPDAPFWRRVVAALARTARPPKDESR